MSPKMSPEMAQQIAGAFRNHYLNNNYEAAKIIAKTFWQDKTGELPIQLYHGTVGGPFIKFDMSKLGSNTGGGYFKQADGTEIPYDTNRAIFLTDNDRVAFSYGAVGVEQILDKLRLLSDKPTLTQKEQLFVKAWLPKFPLLKAAVDNHDDNAFWVAMSNYGTARTVSNQYNNYRNQEKDLETLDRDIARIIQGDKRVKFTWGPLSDYDVHFFETPSKKSFGIFTGQDGKLKFRFNDVIKDASSIQSPQSVINWAKSIHQEGVQDFLKRNKEYLDNITVMPVWAQVKNPLVHNYNGSAFPDMYVNIQGQRTKYPTEYVAARLVDKAIREGNDAVIYENIKDPFKSITYGIFKPENIKSSNPFTFDENGELINIDKRFNFDVNNLNLKSGGKIKQRFKSDNCV